MLNSATIGQFPAAAEILSLILGSAFPGPEDAPDPGTTHPLGCGMQNEAPGPINGCAGPQRARNVANGDNCATVDSGPARTLAIRTSDLLESPGPALEICTVDRTTVTIHAASRRDPFGDEGSPPEAGKAVAVLVPMEEYRRLVERQAGLKLAIGELVNHARAVERQAQSA